MRDKLTQPASRVALTVMGHAAVDLAAAPGLLFGLALILGLGFGLARHAAGGDEPAGIIKGSIDQAAQNPWDPAGGLWLTLMPVSTLIPTALHVPFLPASPLALIHVGKQRRRDQRRKLADDLKATDWDTPAADAGAEHYRSDLPTKVTRELVRGNAGIWAGAVLLFVLLLVLLVAAMALLFGEPGFAAWVAYAAHGGVWLAEAVGTLLGS